MADEIDVGSERAQEILEDALKEHSLKNQPVKPYEENEGDVECEDCGVIIPEIRRRHGCHLCIDCQQWEDKCSKVRKIRGGDF